MCIYIVLIHSLFAVQRLHDFDIYVTTVSPSVKVPPHRDMASAQLCHHYDGTLISEEIVVIECDAPGPVNGSYVIVQIKGEQECLSICELEIYGRLPDGRYNATCDYIAKLGII